MMAVLSLGDKACEFARGACIAIRAYRPGRSPNWVKVKNPRHPAMIRETL
jgi:hypothetical protein